MLSGVGSGAARCATTTRTPRSGSLTFPGTHDELSTPTKVGQMTTRQADKRVAVVTGASAGIGEATARTLAAQGFHVVCVARRADRIKALADEIDGTAIVADVTDDDAVAALADGLDRVDVLVNNAGGAKGLEPVADADLEHWRWMWETNVLGTLRVTRALLPKLIDSGDGLIVTITSIAAFEIYDGGSGYTSAKHAARRVAPHAARRAAGKAGAAHRDCAGRGGDGVLPGALRRRRSKRADAVYEGITPLVAEDIAEVIGFVASRPSHVNLDQIVIRPRDQASATRRVGRSSSGCPTGWARRSGWPVRWRECRAADACALMRRHRHPLVPVDGPVPDVAVGVGQLDRGAGDLDRVAVDGAVEVLLRVTQGQVDAAVGDVGVALRARAGRVGVDELAVVGDPHREPLAHVGVAGGRVGHVEVFVLLAHHVDAAAGDVARQVALAVAAREVHDDAGVGDHLDAVRGRFGL